MHTQFRVMAAGLMVIQACLQLGCAKGTAGAPATAPSATGAPLSDEVILSLPSTPFPPAVREHLNRLCQEALGPHPFEIYRTCKHEPSGWVYCYLQENLSAHSVRVLMEVDPEMKRVVRFKSEGGEWKDHKPVDE